MIEFGGSLAKLLNDIFDQTFGPIPSSSRTRFAITGPP
jgi:hypothetical protein